MTTVPANEIIGLMEAAEMLRLSRSAAKMLPMRRESTRFPEPLARLAMGPVYRRGDVAAWASDVGRPFTSKTWTRRGDVVAVDDLMGLSEIAALADTGKTNVSSWMDRRRVNGFPQPLVQLTMGGVYARSEVEPWLRAHGYLRDEAKTEVITSPGQSFVVIDESATLTEPAAATA
jgi:hypothetical protein